MAGVSMFSAGATPVEAAPVDLAEVLEPLRAKHRLVALGGAVVTPAGLRAVGVTGERKHKSGVRAAAGDRFHIGSCTKAMTAALLATFVEEGRISWSDTLGRLLPAEMTGANPAYRDVTLEQVLAHRAGFSGESGVKGKSILDLHHLPGSVREHRRFYVGETLRQAPVVNPGSQEIYSNAGYVLAGFIAERLADRSYEELMVERLFRPLGMKSAGFGAMGTPGTTDEPWQHRVGLFGIRPIEPGPLSDNPPLLSPAGRVHCSLADWAAFAALHLRASGPDRPPLKSATLKRIQTPTGEYGFGWGMVDRDWAGGRVLTHAGSNTLSYAVAWLAPIVGFGVLVTCNQGGGKTDRAVDEVAGRLIEWYREGN